MVFPCVNQHGETAAAPHAPQEASAVSLLGDWNTPEMHKGALRRQKGQWGCVGTRQRRQAGMPGQFYNSGPR